jgi:formate dehydrogenase iron-sulfur subunit
MMFGGWQSSSLVIDRNDSSGLHEVDSHLIGTFLDEQGDLTAVERFSQFHEDAAEPLQGQYYSALMPVRPPAVGEQLAFEVDLDRCSGCKACVAACHNLNGLDEGESWRDVGLIIGGRPDLPVLQHVTSACHHCLDPACLSACPVDAYEKDPVTGIVRHLDDQCFGCQYCILACPYDAPKFHPGKGIVRKCDLCGDRLASGEAPACVQACPHEAIRIRIVNVGDVVARARSGDFLPTAPDPGYTLPTTVFRSSRLGEPDVVRAADENHVAPEHAHWPLVAMLVFTQLSVGGFVMELIASGAGWTAGQGMTWNAILSLAVGWAGLGASLLHLGRPLYAYRAIIGLRHSWLSREVLAFGLFAKLATAYTALRLVEPGWFAAPPFARTVLLASVVVTGLSGVACSVLVYHVVRRPFWRAGFGGVKFAGTVVVLGLATALAAHGIAAARSPDLLREPVSTCPIWAVALTLMAATAVKLGLEARMLRRLAESELISLQKTAFLLRGVLKRPAGLRRFLGLAGGLAMPSLAALAAAPAPPGGAGAAATLALAALVAGELTERYLFFTAVVRPKMPGGFLP